MVALANGLLRLADGIADSLLQFLSASFAVGVAEFFERATRVKALQPGLALLAERNCSGRWLVLTTLLRFGHTAHHAKGVKRLAALKTPITGIHHGFGWSAV